MNRLQEKRNLPLLSVSMEYKIAIERADPRSFYPYCPLGGLFHPGLGSKKGNHGSVYESELTLSNHIFYSGRDKLFAERVI